MPLISVGPVTHGRARSVTTRMSLAARTNAGNHAGGELMLLAETLPDLLADEDLDDTRCQV